MEDITSQKASQPEFKDRIIVEVNNYLTGQKFFLQSIDSSFNCSSEAAKQVMDICSQQAVYDFLFGQDPNGRPYTIRDARKFLNWAKKGWQNKTYFVFLIKDGPGRIVGALDIKSPKLEGGEIGYWADPKVRGFMTNAVMALCNVARDAGYKFLYALTLPENPKSIRVLERAGFEKKGTVCEKGKEHFKYEIIFK
jgi:RimJ/RimL family protein N-acetyltransferase